MDGALTTDEIPENGAIIMAAPNGATKTKRDHPQLPITPDEIAAEAKRCLRSGASVFHMHVRDETGAHSLDPLHYEKALEAVHQKISDQMIVQITTEAAGVYETDAQIEVVRAIKPEAASLAVKEFVRAPEDLDTFAKFLNEVAALKVWPQFILYDPDDLKILKDLRAADKLPFAEPYLLFVLGRYTLGQVSEPSAVEPFREALQDFGPARWSLCAFGRTESICAKHALENGGDVRVGFENNMMLPDGQIARSTSELVSLAAESALVKGRVRLSATQIRSMITNGGLAGARL